jgi:DNA-binding transcriptional ArsR family regulator
MASTKTGIKSTPTAKAAAGKRKGFRAAEQRSPQARQASTLLKHVSDPTRRQLILILSDGERHVAALSAQLSQSQATVSHHLALLRHGGIIATRHQGKKSFYTLTDAGAVLATVVKNHAAMPQRKPRARYLLCVKNDANPVSLELRKVYKALPDAVAASRGFVRVIDESGEDYLFPSEWFVAVDLPREAIRVFAGAS